MTDRTRIAIVGCGAIAERFHLPALAAIPDVPQGLVFVDPVPARAKALRDSVGSGTVAESLSEILGQIDGAIITAPHSLHVPLAESLLKARVPVLCEKPLADSSASASDLCTLADSLGVPLAVNNTRRLYPINKKVRELIAGGELGPISSITFDEGDKFDWPLASPSLFGRSSGGHGILLDIGAHVIDLVCWWLGERPSVREYHDDAMGGSEAWSRVRLKSSSGCDVQVRLSWLTKLPNRIEIQGEGGTIRAGIYDWASYEHRRNGRVTRHTISSGPSTNAGFARELTDNFVNVVRGNAAPLVPGRAVLDSIAVIEECYARRSRIDMPWFDAWQKVAQ